MLGPLPSVPSYDAASIYKITQSKMCSSTPNKGDELYQSHLIGLFLQLIWAERTERTLGKSAVTTSIVDRKQIDELATNRSEEGFRRDELWIQECGPPKTQAAYIYKRSIEAQLKSFVKAASQENKSNSLEFEDVDTDTVSLAGNARGAASSATTLGCVEMPRSEHCIQRLVALACRMLLRAKICDVQIKAT